MLARRLGDLILGRMKRSYHTLASSGLKTEREARTQELIFPGYDHMVVPNIHIL